MRKRSTILFVTQFFSLFIAAFSASASPCPKLDDALCPNRERDFNALEASLAYFERGMIRPVLREMGIFETRALPPWEQDRYVKLLMERLNSLTKNQTEKDIKERVSKVRASVETQLRIVQEPGPQTEASVQRLKSLEFKAPTEFVASRRVVFDEACGPFAHVPNAVWVKAEESNPNEFVAICPALLFAAQALSREQALDLIETAIAHAFGRAVDAEVRLKPEAKKCAELSLGTRITWSSAWTAEVLTRSSASNRLVCALPTYGDLPAGLERVRAVFGGNSELRTQVGCTPIQACELSTLAP